MSHYLCLVVLPKHTVMQHVEAQASRLLAPYDENLELPPREEPCWCVGVRSRVPSAEAPAAPCIECDDSGVRLSTFNPLARWDWWAIGGRWDGWIFGPERETAPGGGAGGFNLDGAHRTPENNARPARDIPLDEVDGMPFAVVTPDGHWHGASDAAPGGWRRHVKELVGRYPDHLAVAVDCHT